MTVIGPSVAVVTGAARGIGAAVAAHLAGQGYAVVVNYRTNATQAAAVAENIVAAGGRAAAFAADVSDEAQAAALIDFAVARFGGLHLLVNNAGLAQGRKLNDIDAAHVDAHLSVNIRGLLFACKHAVRVFSGTGVIVNISSVNATSPVPGGAVYSGSKAAVDAITISLARELGPRGIRVNAIAPGLTMTARYLEEVPDDAKAGVIAETPLRRLGVPEDLVGVVAFLASDAARWITGQVMTVSGGAV